jgi:hypothetical protein
MSYLLNQRRYHSRVDLLLLHLRTGLPVGSEFDGRTHWEDVIFKSNVSFLSETRARDERKVGALRAGMVPAGASKAVQLLFRVSDLAAPWPEVDRLRDLLDLVSTECDALGARPAPADFVFVCLPEDRARYTDFGVPC